VDYNGENRRTMNGESKKAVKGWNIFEPSKGGSRFERYRNQMVVMLTEAKNNYLYISHAVFDAMGKPERIQVMTRGSNVGLTAAADGGGYKTQQHHEGDTPYISLTKFRKAFPFQPGVYDVHMEAGGVAVFDSQGTPSALN
jgi:hypothetical protein